MKYIKELHEGETIRSIYLCKGKRSAETRNGKPYDNLILQDKTGTLDGKIWDPNSQGIADYDEKDFVEVVGDVITYNNNLQLNIKQLRIASEDEYNPGDYMPTSEKSVDGMYEELLGYIRKISNPYLRQAVEYYFVKDEAFMFKIIRASFNQRRKTLQNGLNNASNLSVNKEQVVTALEKMGLPATVRGEALSLEQFAELSNLLKA